MAAMVAGEGVAGDPVATTAEPVTVGEVADECDAWSPPTPATVDRDVLSRSRVENPGSETKRN